MDLSNILKSLENCPCGRPHNIVTEVVEIGHGVTERTGEILDKANFPKNVLLVADEITLGVSAGILESLAAAGFHVKKLIYENMKYARIEQVNEVKALLSDVDGLISVGTGSLNDICRVAAFDCKKKFCIFATAPSMDGFASDTAPILENNFKSSFKAEQPHVILADTRILAASPAELKSSGFGDMMAKYIGIVDWKISNILTGEYYCDKIADLTLLATNKCFDMADQITAESEEAAGAVMEALVLSGLAMKLAGCSRPASGAEHVVSHYLECYKVVRGIWPEFHGKKVGVATVLITKAYRKIAETFESVDPVKDPFDLEEVLRHYDPQLKNDIVKLNTPTITETIDPALLKEKWGEIREVIFKYLPEVDVLLEKMHQAGAATTMEEVHVSDELLTEALRYHAYMRYRVLLTRLLPMLGLDIMDYVK
ncbi:MAG: iron-containing alcohol dehydrogenase [Clostridia bacterium]|nr:iron-containing alcohol dehydrogenase [Clostridia bacterium]